MQSDLAVAEVWTRARYAAGTRHCQTPQHDVTHRVFSRSAAGVVVSTEISRRVHDAHASSEEARASLPLRAPETATVARWPGAQRTECRLPLENPGGFPSQARHAADHADGKYTRRAPASSAQPTHRPLASVWATESCAFVSTPSGSAALRLEEWVGRIGSAFQPC